jgi:D-arabinose 1-dehydrogenase-like Zn-dependent alcohol dehydrogenase
MCMERRSYVASLGSLPWPAVLGGHARASGVTLMEDKAADKTAGVVPVVAGLVAISEKAHPSPSVASLIGLRRSLAASLVGRIKETQGMLDFCAENGVVADTEAIPRQEIETAFARIVKNDVKYRFVVDMKSLKRNH